AMNNQVCNTTKSTPYELVFGQQPQADLQMISMLYRQNIVHEEDILLENQSTFINDDLSNNYENNSDRIIVIEDSNNDNNYDLKSNNDSIIDNKMNISRDYSMIEEYTDTDTDSLYRYNSIDLKNDNYDLLLDETFQENYKSNDNLSQTDTVLEGLTQESTNSLFKESLQASSSYILIDDSDHEIESHMSIDNQSHSS
ncbi:5175_t:CDS:2, partial [Dentiscutata erythropus]